MDAKRHNFDVMSHPSIQMISMGVIFALFHGHRLWNGQPRMSKCIYVSPVLFPRGKRTI
jgi:hypothetical protein